MTKQQIVMYQGIQKLLRSFVVGAVILGGTVSSAYAQEDFSTLRFYGGNVSINSNLDLNILGTGTLGQSFGGVYSARVGAGAGAVFANPAELGRLGKASLMVNSRARILSGDFITPDELLDAADVSIRAETIPTLRDNLYFDESDCNLNVASSGCDFVETELSNVNVGFNGGVSSFGVGIPLTESVGIGVGMYKPISLGFGLRATGLEMYLDAAQQTGDQTVAINFLAGISLNAAIGMDVSAFAVGAGATVYETEDLRVSVGASLEQLFGRTQLYLNALPSAMVILSRSTEYYFNDPSDRNLTGDDTNMLMWDVMGDYKGSAAGFRASAGVDYQFLSLTLGYRSGYTLEMTDPNARATSFTPNFLNLFPDDICDTYPDDDLPAECEQINFANIDLAKPNLTKQTLDSLGQEMSLELPSVFSIGLDAGFGKTNQHTVAVNASFYSGSLEMQGVYGGRGRASVDPYTIGFTPDIGVGLGLDLQFADELSPKGLLLLPVRLLFLDFDGLLMQALGGYTGYADPHYRIGFSAALGTYDVTHLLAEDADQRQLVDDLNALGILPTGFSLGRQYTIFDRLDIAVNVIALPNLVAQTGLVYHIK